MQLRRHRPQREPALDPASPEELAERSIVGDPPDTVAVGTSDCQHGGDGSNGAYMLSIGKQWLAGRIRAHPIHLKATAGFSPAQWGSSPGAFHRSTASLSRVYRLRFGGVNSWSRRSVVRISAHRVVMKTAAVSSDARPQKLQNAGSGSSALDGFLSIARPSSR